MPRKTQLSCPLHLERPLVLFDIESTGLSKQTDRIIDIALLKIYPNGKMERHYFRVNPGKSIPPEATQVHGITDDDVKGKPSFSEIAPALLAILEGCDLGGFNVASFDIPMLETEFQRAGHSVDLSSRNIVDAQRIFHKKVPRDLQAALAYYCNELHLDAHNAMGDVEATWRILCAQLNKYADIPHDVPKLAQFCFPQDPSWLDRKGRFRKVNGEVMVCFGKYKDRALKKVAREDPQYLRSLIEKGYVESDCFPIIKDAIAAASGYPSPNQLGQNSEETDTLPEKSASTSHGDHSHSL